MKRKSGDKRKIAYLLISVLVMFVFAILFKSYRETEVTIRALNSKCEQAAATGITVMKIIIDGKSYLPGEIFEGG